MFQLYQQQLVKRPFVTNSVSAMFIAGLGTVALYTNYGTFQRQTSRCWPPGDFCAQWISWKYRPLDAREAPFTYNPRRGARVRVLWICLLRKPLCRSSLISGVLFWFVHWWANVNLVSILGKVIWKLTHGLSYNQEGVQIFFAVSFSLLI